MQATTTPKTAASRIAIRGDVLHIALLCCGILLGGVLRFFDLGGESYWTDEMKMILVAGGSLSSILEAAVQGRPPMYVLLAHAWMGLFGTTEAATRSLSALISTLSLGMIYLVGRQLFDRRVGLLSVALMAAAEFQIAQAQNFRYYSLFVLMTLVSFFCMHRALRGGGRRWFALYALASVLLFFTHTYGIFVVAGQNLFFLLRWREHRPLLWRWALAQAAIAAATAPGLVVAYAYTSPDMPQSVHFEWIPDRPLWYPLVTLYRYVFPARELPHLEQLLAAAALCGAGAGLGALREPRWAARLRELPHATLGAARGQAYELLLTACWLAAPIVCPLVISKILDPIYVDRYTISASPALYLLIAWVLVQVRRLVPLWAPLAALAVLIAPGLYTYYAAPVREQWREAGALVEAQQQPGDVVVFAPAENGAVKLTFDWYYRGGLPDCGLDVALTQPEAIAAALEPCAAGKQRLWWVMRGSQERTAAFRDFFLKRPDGRMRLAEETRLTDISIYLFDIERR